MPADIPVFFDARLVANAHSFSPSAGKPEHVVESWKQLGIPLRFEPFDAATVDQLCLAHSRRYVEGVLAGRLENGFGNTLVDVARALPWTCGAMLAATREAIGNKAVAVAPVSGFHHAGHSHAAGYCTFNGLIVAARAVLHEKIAKRVGILDFDMHYGNGTADIVCDLELADDIVHFTAGKTYRHAHQAEGFLQRIPELLKQFVGCDVLLYQAGADPHIDDPLGGSWPEVGFSTKATRLTGIAIRFARIGAWGGADTPAARIQWDGFGRHETKNPPGWRVSWGISGCLGTVLDVVLVQRRESNRIRQANAQAILALAAFALPPKLPPAARR